MNTTTLNMTTLDGGNVIIKRGTAPAPPSGEGGSNLSPDAIVLAPNGWYWKFTDEAISSGIWYNIMVMSPRDFGLNYYGGKAKYKLSGDYRDVWYNLGLYTAQDEKSERHIIYAFSESIGCKTAIDEQTYIVGDSLYELFNQIQPMTEAEFEAFVLGEMSLQRLTKEEYEALIIEEGL
jgi:hypothetical protein